MSGHEDWFVALQSTNQHTGNAGPSPLEDRHINDVPWSDSIGSFAMQ
jgi:hypothetical protein